jgi:hypothetical protein
MATKQELVGMALGVMDAKAKLEASGSFSPEQLALLTSIFAGMEVQPEKIVADNAKSVGQVQAESFSKLVNEHVRPTELAEMEEAFGESAELEDSLKAVKAREDAVKAEYDVVKAERQSLEEKRDNSKASVIGLKVAQRVHGELKTSQFIVNVIRDNGKLLITARKPGISKPREAKVDATGVAIPSAKEQHKYTVTLMDGTSFSGTHPQIMKDAKFGSLPWSESNFKYSQTLREVVKDLWYDKAHLEPRPMRVKENFLHGGDWKVGDQFCTIQYQTA